MKRSELGNRRQAGFTFWSIVFYVLVLGSAMVLALRIAHFEELSESEFTCFGRKCFAADQIRAHTVECAFFEFGELVVERFGDDQIEHRIAQKFKSLIVMHSEPEAGVLEGELQKITVFKTVINVCHQLVEAGLHC